MKRLLIVGFVTLFACTLSAWGVFAAPIRIGDLSDFTATYAALGAEQRRGLDMAVDELNAKGGLLGRKLVVIDADDASSPSQGATKAEQLFLQDKVDFLFGSISSGVTLNVMNVAIKHKRLMMVPISMSPKITGSDCSRDVFRVASNVYFESRSVADRIVHDAGGKAFFLAADYEWGKSTTAAFKSALEAAGGQSVGEEYFPLGTKDFAPYFGKIQAAHPGALVLVAAGNDAISAISQISEFGLNKRMKIYGPGSMTSGDVLRAVGKKADGINTVDQYSPALNTPRNKAFVAKFEKRYTNPPTKFAVATYESMMWLAQAVRKAHSINADKVAAALAGSHFVGPQGAKTMRAGDHQAMMNMYSLVIRNGKQVVEGLVPAKNLSIPNECKAL